MLVSGARFTAKEGLYVGPTLDSIDNYLVEPSENGKVWEAGEIKINTDIKTIQESLAGTRIYPAFNEFTDETDETFQKPSPFIIDDQIDAVYKDKNVVIRHAHTRGGGPRMSSMHVCGHSPHDCKQR